MSYVDLMADYKAKQILVMRKDLNMRKGKMCAQAAHASMAFMTNRMRPIMAADDKFLDDEYVIATPMFNEAECEWLDNSFTKVCVYVESEEELLAVRDTALNAQLEVQVITDAGLTEFAGVPTKTCLAVGPDWNDKVDAVTAGLPLL